MDQAILSETEWMSCIQPERMLELARHAGSERKLRLFAVACCRDMVTRLGIEAIPAVNVAENYAEGRGSAMELAQAQHQPEGWYLCNPTQAWDAVFWACHPDRAADVVQYVCEASLKAIVWVAQRAAERFQKERARALEDAWYDTVSTQAGLLRHIIGNPFRHPQAPASWPDHSTTKSLSTSPCTMLSWTAATTNLPATSRRRGIRRDAGRWTRSWGCREVSHD